MITHCPSANENSSKTEKIMLEDIAAVAITVESIGVEHGLETNAKKVPVKKGITNKLPELFLGMFFIGAGIGIVMTSKRLKPIIKSMEANIKITAGEAKFVNIFPVTAQITPIMLKTIESPKENESICINNFLPFSFE